MPYQRGSDRVVDEKVRIVAVTDAEDFRGRKVWKHQTLQREDEKTASRIRHVFLLDHKLLQHK